MVSDSLVSDQTYVDNMKKVIGNSLANYISNLNF